MLIRICQKQCNCQVLKLTVLVSFIIFEIKNFTKFWKLHLYFLEVQLFVRQIVPEALKSPPVWPPSPLIFIVQSYSLCQRQLLLSPSA